MHVQIVRNLVGALVNATVDGPWIVLRSSMKFYAPMGDSDVYPDVSVVWASPLAKSDPPLLAKNGPGQIIDLPERVIGITRDRAHDPRAECRCASQVQQCRKESSSARIGPRAKH